MLNMKLEVGGLERKSVEQKSASIELLTSGARGMRGASAVLMTALLVVTLPAIAVQEWRLLVKYDTFEAIHAETS